MDERYDVIVIGAGPAGLMAGIEAARSGCAVLIAERNDRIGVPLHCAEGVTAATFHQLIEPRPSWIVSHPVYGRIVTPSGQVLQIRHNHGGYILDRVRMQQDLAEEFVGAGGTLVTTCRATRLIHESDVFVAVELAEADRNRTVLARVFIAADGVEGTIARLAGIDNRLHLEETESYLQYRLEGLDIDPEAVELHLGSQVAPGSYGWVFPRSDREATVGLGVLNNGTAQKTVREYLDDFVERRLGGGTILATSCGTVPRYGGSEKLALDNMMVVGDAARITDSLTGAGILTAIQTGKMAGEAAAGLVQGRWGSVRAMRDCYPGRFLKQQHDYLSRLLDIKKFITRLSDADLDELLITAAEWIGNGPVESINPVRAVIGVIRKRPRLLKLARHLL